MQIYGMKDLLLSQEQVNNFDRAMDTEEIIGRGDGPESLLLPS